MRSFAYATMPRTFLYHAQNPDGQPVVDRIEAADLGEAKLALEKRGYTEIVFVTDENEDLYRRAALAGTGLKDEDIPEQGAHEDAAGIQRKGLAAHLWWVVKQHLFPVGALAAWNLSSWFGTRPFGWGDWLGFAASPLYVIYFFKLSLPLLLYQAILEAATRHDHAQLKQLVTLCRALRRLAIAGIPPSELDFREAGSLAAQGKLDAALAMIERWRADPSMPEAVFLGRLASLYENAGDYTKMVALTQEAAALNTTGATAWIDCAAARIRRLRDVEGAKAALARVGEVELAALPCAFKNLVEGIISVEEGADEKAVGLLEGAIEDLGKFGNPLLGEVISEAHGYLLLAEARLGRLDAARDRFVTAKALLKLNRAKDLYPRCLAAVAGGA